MANICIIPARGGSKRILRKNIKDFLGKPILAYSIEAAIESNLFDEVMVSTDDKEIAKIAEKYGANIPFLRSDKNSDDFSTTYDVLYEVLGDYKNKKNREFQNLCCIYPCAPFVNSKMLSKSYSKLIDKNLDVIFPILPYSFPIQRALREKDGNVKMINEEFMNTRSQDLESTYHDAGQFYWCTVSGLFENKKLISKNAGGIIVSELNAQDIDNETDWKLAELKYKLNKRS